MENQRRTDASTTGRNRPTIKKQSKIAYNNKVFSLPEGNKYFGQIVDSHQFTSKKDENEYWSLTIKLDGRNTKFCNINKLELSEYSPLNGLLAEIDKDETGEADPEELIGYMVEFTTKITDDGFCGFKTINFIYEEDDEDTDGEEDESDDSDDEDENE